MTEDEAPSPTLDWVAKKMGYSVSGVSLIRSGNRRPTINTMETIEAAFDWPVFDQIQARRDGKYAEAFNQATTKKFKNENQEN